MRKYRINRKQFKFVCFSLIFVLGACSLAWASSDSGGSGNHWLKIDTLKAFNFSVLVIAFFFLSRKVVAEFFSSRKKNIEKELKDLEEKKADAENQLREYRAKFNNLDQESKKIIEDFVRQGKEARDRIIAEAEAQASKLESTARSNIEQEFKSAKDQLRQEIIEKGMESAETAIKKYISKKDQDRLVGEYLKKVVA